MRKKAVQLAKGQDEEKVGISLKIPKNLKDRLQMFSEAQEVSMNSLIVSCIELMLDDSCGNLLKQIDSVLVEKLGSLQNDLSGFQIVCEDDAIIYENLKSESECILSLLNQVRNYI